MKSYFLALMTLIGFLMISCNQPQQNVRKPLAKHVILIGIDGWAATNFDKAPMPIVKDKLMAEGSYTLEKRSVLPSASAINWASNFMGVGTESHGYTTWGSKVPEIPSSVTNAHGIFPTIFSILKEQQPESKTAAIFDWDGIKYVIDTLAVDHVMQRDHAGYGKEFGEDCGEPLDYVKEAVNVIKEEKPTLFAVYFGGLDETGHTYGWYTEKYYDFEKVLDESIAQLIEATKEAGIYDDTIFVLTADHGGIDKGHGGITLEEMLSPFIVYGKGIRKGFQMTDAMMQYDVAATVAYILGLETPQAWVGRPMLSIFE
jgi:predicted AlkP superfamily pyrophosphatase or phosphodiesterase